MLQSKDECSLAISVGCFSYIAGAVVADGSNRGNIVNLGFRVAMKNESEFTAQARLTPQTREIFFTMPPWHLNRVDKGFCSSRHGDPAVGNHPVTRVNDEQHLCFVRPLRQKGHVGAPESVWGNRGKGNFRRVWLSGTGRDWRCVPMELLEPPSTKGPHLAGFYSDSMRVPVPWAVFSSFDTPGTLSFAPRWESSTPDNKASLSLLADKHPSFQRDMPWTPPRPHCG